MAMSKTTTTTSPLNITMTRTIHPVGQGAFYRETFFDISNNPLFTAVYDCGGRINPVREEIKLLSKVDILFISHFHSDHINGIRYLIDDNVVKRIVFPFISHRRFLVDFVLNCIKTESEGAIELMLMLLPMIRSARTGNGPYFINGIELSPVMDGGPRGKPISSPVPIWGYSVFYKSETDDSKERAFLEELSLHTDISDVIVDCMKDYQDVLVYQKIAESIKKKNDLMEQIKNAYSIAFKGNHNSYSMLVLSHQIVNDEIERKRFDCLYTGDVVVDKWALDIASETNPDYVQVPHHGSNHNHHPSLYKKRPTVFISTGVRNRYHHPGLTTLSDTLRMCKEVHIITEDYYSAFIRSIRL